MITCMSVIRLRSHGHPSPPLCPIQFGSARCGKAARKTLRYGDFGIQPARHSLPQPFVSRARERRSGSPARIGAIRLIGKNGRESDYREFRCRRRSRLEGPPRNATPSAARNCLLNQCKLAQDNPAHPRSLSLLITRRGAGREGLKPAGFAGN